MKLQGVLCLVVILRCGVKEVVAATLTASDVPSVSKDTKDTPPAGGKDSEDTRLTGDKSDDDPDLHSAAVPNKDAPENGLPASGDTTHFRAEIKNGIGDSPTAKTDPSSDKSGPSRPHIVMIVADDLGWNDVSWMDRTMYTPVLARLASEGVVLNKAYVQPVCSPSRAAFMSGYYPYHLGMQHNGLTAQQKAYMPGNITTLPQHLKKLGYKTHMAGKWHLGFCNWRYTPTYRGFDSFVGFYNAEEGYYNHTGHWHGYDFRHNEDVYYAANGTYSAHVFTEYIAQVIAKHDVSEPLFVYLPYQSVHGPFEVPQYYIDRYCSHVENETRRIHCGMGAALDEGVGNVTRALQRKGIFNDTILLFTTDNGGPVKKGSNNWPLRGSKGTLWEGGTRGIAFLHGPQFFPNSGRTYDGLIHAVDWLPTLVEAAGGPRVTGLDGVSQWQSIVRGLEPSARTEFVYNFDEIRNNSAIRQGRFKLLQGDPGNPSGWYPPPNTKNERLPFKDTRLYFEKESDLVDIDRNREASQLTDSHGGEAVRMKPTEEYQLYDLDADPTERNDVKDKYPAVFKQMVARMEELRKSLVPANYPPGDPASLPFHFGGVWSPGWC